VILQLLTWLATAGIISIFVHAVRLWLVSRPAAVPPATVHAAADGFLFTFVVPALNEARVIEHTLDRLLSLPVRHCLVLVIDDGSDDGTGYLVESHHDPRVRLCAGSSRTRAAARALR
jgi:1,2-diacylglycerol 3-beta-glucosyltransferase